jgi:hypothetical protein
VPSGRAKFPGAHDLGADPMTELLGEGVVDAATTAGLLQPFGSWSGQSLSAPPPGGEHPFVQPLPGVTEICVVAQALTGAEAVE